MNKSIHSHLYHQVIGRLRSKREMGGVTQVQLAELLKVNQAFVSKVETCERRLDIIELHHICQVLGISFVDFIQEVDRDILSKMKEKVIQLLKIFKNKVWKIYRKNISYLYFCGFICRYWWLSYCNA